MKISPQQLQAELDSAGHGGMLILGVDDSTWVRIESSTGDVSSWKNVVTFLERAGYEVQGDEGETTGANVRWKLEVPPLRKEPQFFAPGDRNHLFRLAGLNPKRVAEEDAFVQTARGCEMLPTALPILHKALEQLAEPAEGSLVKIVESVKQIRRIAETLRALGFRRS